jgi:hypothetical protein
MQELLKVETALNENCNVPPLHLEKDIAAAEHRVSAEGVYGHIL